MRQNEASNAIIAAQSFQIIIIRAFIYYFYHVTSPIIIHVNRFHYVFILQCTDTKLARRTGKCNSGTGEGIVYWDEP